MIEGRLTHQSNPLAKPAADYPAELRDFFDETAAQAALEEISGWPGYAATPLLDLDDLAQQAGVARIWYKDESQRFVLKSFKALGGAYAVLRLLQQQVEAGTGRRPQLEEFARGELAELVGDTVISCATDGNHGRSVAWGCRQCGCRCVIYIHRDVSAYRERAMQELGAEVVRIEGNYDDSVRRADEDARRFGRIIVSDTSYPGYMEIPRDVMHGYSVMLSEAVSQLDGQIPTHVFIQGGVGGLAAAVCAFFWQTWGARRPRFVVVEPEQANCLQESARAGKPVVVEGDLETLMAGLACGEVSALAWPILAAGADDFMTVDEASVAPVMRLLRARQPSIEAGESGVAGIAAALIAARDPEMAGKLGLDADSRIFVIGTEGATDPQVYRELTE